MYLIAIKNYAVTYYQTQEEILWSLKLEKAKKTPKMFKKLKKECNFYQKIAIACETKWLKIIP